MEWPKERGELLYKQCIVEDVEDEEHFMLRCEVRKQERDMVIESVGDLVRTSSGDRKVALILNQNHSNGRILQRSCSSADSRTPDLYDCG